MKRNIILLHGLFGGMSNWQHVITHFQDKFNLLVPALPIYDEHQENILDYLVESLREAVEVTGQEKVILVGNSLGGHVAILYTHRYPDSVEKLVLTGSSGLYEDYSYGSFVRRRDYAYIRKRVEYTFYDPHIATKEQVDEIVETLADARKSFRIIKTAKAAQRHQVTRLLPDITISVLLIWGKDDKITPRSAAEEFNRLIPYSELLYLNDCGHVPMMERPEAFNAAMDSFLSS
jgi:pimeloyl-ACP methyl ester carboxylesterase